MYNSNSSATNPERKKFVESVASKNYKGPSVVDYLSASNYDPSKESRAQLAKEQGIEGYDFSGAKNLELMSKLKSGTTTPGGGDTTGAGTPTTTTTPKAQDPNFQAYLDSLNETDEEKSAREYVSRLLTDSKSAYEKAIQSGETMGFAQGEGARVKRANDMTIDAAAGAYDVLKTGAERKRSVAKLRYDFANEQKKAEEAATKPFELSEGQTRYQYNPETKSYEVIAAKPKTYKPTTTKSSSSSVTKPTQTQNRNADVNLVVETLEKVKKAKNQYGIDPTSLKYYKDQILKAYGSAGVNELTRQLKAKGLAEDTAQDPKNYK